MQKGSKSSCIFLLVGCPLFIFFVYRYLPVALAEDRVWFAVPAGILLAMGLSSLGLLFAGKVESVDDVMEKTRTGLADGEQALVTGRLRAPSSPLRAPISDTPCAAYFYRMYKLVRHRNSDRPIEQVPVYWGYASSPFLVETPSRAFQVRGAPVFIVPPTPLSGDEAIARARTFVQSTPAEERNPRVVFASDPVRQWMDRLSSADDGSARHHWKSGDEDPSSLYLEESLLLPDIEVSVHGPWSARHNAIASGDNRGEVRVAPGPPSAVGGLVPRSATTYWVSTLITLGLGVAVIWFAINVWPRMN